MDRAAWALFRRLVLTKPHGHMFNSKESRDKRNSADRALHQNLDDKIQRGCNAEVMSCEDSREQYT